jgi:hypothetical protein
LPNNGRRYYSCSVLLKDKGREKEEQTAKVQEQSVHYFNYIAFLQDDRTSYEHRFNYSPIFDKMLACLPQKVEDTHPEIAILTYKTNQRTIELVQKINIRQELKNMLDKFQQQLFSVHSIRATDYVGVLAIKLIPTEEPFKDSTVSPVNPFFG